MVGARRGEHVDELSRFNAIKQKPTETSHEYWVRFMDTVEALKCFGNTQFLVPQRTQFNQFVYGLRDNLRKITIPRLASPNAEGQRAL